MARISLLFSLALVLAIGSVLAHPPTHKKTPPTLCPSTLSKLQTFPFTEITKYIEKKSQFAPDTIQFKALFAICKSYNDYIGSFAFTRGQDVFGSVHAKFGSMTKSLFAAQAHAGVNGQLGVKLSKSYIAMAEGYVRLVEKIAVISAKYKFNANAQISMSDRAEIQKCLIKLKSAIRVYVVVISQCSKNFSAAKKKGISIGDGEFFGASSLTNGLGVHARVKLGATQVGAKVGAKSGSKFGDLFGEFLGGKAQVGAKVGAKGKAKGGAKSGSKFDDLFGEFLGGKTQFDAAGKVKVSGGDGFKSSSLSSKKHFN